MNLDTLDHNNRQSWRTTGGLVVLIAFLLILSSTRVSNRIILFDASIWKTLLTLMPALCSRSRILLSRVSSATGVNLWNRGSMTYGERYIMNILNARKKHHIHTHHNPGLCWTIYNP